MMGYKIGALAELTRTSTATIRYYEGIDLLPRPARQEGNQRRYDEGDVRRLTFIRRCRDFGFPIEKVRMLVSLVQDRSRSCLDARDLAQTHLDEIRMKLRELRVLEKGIADFIRKCDVECTGGPGPACVILDDLSCGVPMTPLSTAAK